MADALFCEILCNLCHTVCPVPVKLIVTTFALLVEGPVNSFSQSPLAACRKLYQVLFSRVPSLCTMNLETKGFMTFVICDFFLAVLGFEFRTSS
jgi:hypothetical protein